MPRFRAVRPQRSSSEPSRCDQTAVLLSYSREVVRDPLALPRADGRVGLAVTLPPVWDVDLGDTYGTSGLPDIPRRATAAVATVLSDRHGHGARFRSLSTGHPSLVRRTTPHEDAARLDRHLWQE